MSLPSCNVLLVGYGEMGHAFRFLLGDRHQVSVWQRHPDPELPAVDLHQAAAAADVVIYCVPAPPIGELAAGLAPVLRPESLSLTVAKGLDARGRPAAAALADAYQHSHHFGVLYGPMISEEIRAGRPAYAQVGTDEPARFEAVKSLFAGTALGLRHTADVTGISWCAVLKNVYAILYGIADELGFGDNTRGYLTVAALAEMARIVEGLDGRAGTARDLAGLGDLITTATSAGSHHHELGRLLVRGEFDAIKGEGIHTLEMVERHRPFEWEQFELFRLARDLVRDPTDIEYRLRTHVTG